MGIRLYSQNYTHKVCGMSRRALFRVASSRVFFILFENFRFAHGGESRMGHEGEMGLSSSPHLYNIGSRSRAQGFPLLFFRGLLDF